MSLSDALVLREGDRERLWHLAQPTGLSSELAKRAQIVLLAADGMPNAQIARTVGVSRPTVIGWRDRYRQGGIVGLKDEPRSGRPREIDDVDVVVATLADGGRPPPGLGVAQWSARLLAAELGISFASVARIWRKWGIRPDSAEGFTLGTNPGIVLDGHRVAGLYLDPDRHIAALALAASPTGETEQRLPSAPAGRPASEDTLPAVGALVTALTGAGTRVGTNGHSSGDEPHDFVRFLARLGVAGPGAQLRLITDSWTLSEEPAVRYWLAEYPGISFHLPTAGWPWLTVVEIVCGVTGTGDGTRRGGKDVTAAIGSYYEDHSPTSPPFAWVSDLPASADIPDSPGRPRSRVYYRHRGRGGTGAGRARTRGSQDHHPGPGRPSQGRVRRGRGGTGRNGPHLRGGGRGAAVLATVRAAPGRCYGRF
jgi:transposase